MVPVLLWLVNIPYVTPSCLHACLLLTLPPFLPPLPPSPSSSLPFPSSPHALPPPFLLSPLQAKETLAEIPEQFLSFMKSKGITPNPPPLKKQCTTMMFHPQQQGQYSPARLRFHCIHGQCQIWDSIYYRALIPSKSMLPCVMSECRVHS